MIDTTTQYHVRHLQRLPLGMTYPAQMEHLRTLMSRPPLSLHTPLVLDASGVGLAVAQLADRIGLHPLIRTLRLASMDTARHKALICLMLIITAAVLLNSLSRRMVLSPAARRALADVPASGQISAAQALFPWRILGRAC